MSCEVLIMEQRIVRLHHGSAFIHFIQLVLAEQCHCKESWENLKYWYLFEECSHDLVTKKLC